MQLSVDLTTAQKRYLDSQMKVVSRSFALVVPSVEEPLNHYLAAAYLICRVVDNIEDCGEPYEWQAARFGEFERLLSDPASAPATLEAWGRERWPGLTADERRMMGPESGSALWEIYGGIPSRFRRPIAHWAGEMAAGMRAIEDPRTDGLMSERKGIRLPRLESGYNQYCYYVAGTVGHMVTELAIAHYGLDEDTSAELERLSEACGRGLQKTNIVKDFAKDFARGACYLPDEWLARCDHSPLDLAGAPKEWSSAVLEDVVTELREAVGYVLALPESALGYRRASLLSLFPALQTIHRAARNLERLFTADHDIKISRGTMARCVADASRLAGDNAAVADYARRVMAEIDAALGHVPASRDDGFGTSRHDSLGAGGGDRELEA
ncbi:MAG: phytoene/squalene synthase family protein [Anaerolineae bacterium]